MKIFLYTLCCPLTDMPMYVGVSADPKRRLTAHISERNTYDSPKALWIKGLIEKGYKPVMNILSEFQSESEAIKAEERLIKELMSTNPELTNTKKSGGVFVFKHKQLRSRHCEVVRQGRTLVSQRDVEKLKASR